MTSVVRIALNTEPEQFQRLLELQRAFARVCNALSPIVQQTRTWNRVALHHMAYRQLRDAFPEMGSQMVCNAIYSVSRACRMVFQTPGSPLHHSRLAGKPLPLIRFAESGPVYFDRHTLSIKDGTASMYTLDGRIRFALSITPQVEAAFHRLRLSEVALFRRAEAFELTFSFGEPVADLNAEPDQAADEFLPSAVPPGASWPAYLRIETHA